MLYHKSVWMLSPLVFMLLVPAWGRQTTEVDLALVLAVDVSNSMDPDEQYLQRQGYIEAFRSPQVHEAISGDVRGRIAVTYVEWSGAYHPRYQRVVVPWTILESPQDAIAFSNELARAPIPRIGGTSISAAIALSLALLSSNRFVAARRVIDISGDGSNNQGRSVTEARNEAVARGVTINALPIVLKEPGREENVAVDAYYRDCVIGGPGAFMIPVRERHQFLTMTKAKIVQEIANRHETLTKVEPASAVQVNCEAQEDPLEFLYPQPEESATEGRPLP